MPTFDGVKYPDTILDAVKDREIGPMVLKIIARDHDQPLLAVVMQKSNFDPQEYYGTFYQPDAKYELKAFPGLCKRARYYADNQVWDRGEWKKIHDEAYSQSILNLNSVTLAQMYKKDAGFKAFHRDKLEKTVEVTPALLKELNTTDKKSVQKLIAAILTDGKDAKTLAEALVRKRKLKRSGDGLVSFIIELYR